MRSKISRILAGKPKYQIQLDYDFGFALMETDQYAQLIELIREYCLSAVALAAEANEGCIQELKTAIRLSNELIDVNRSLSTNAASHSQLEVFQTAFRMIFEFPGMKSDLETIMTDPANFHHSDPSKLANSVFLDQIVSLRHYDDPSVDQERAPFPLSLLAGNRVNNHSLADCPVRHGNYLPQSSATRKFMLKRLDDWKAGFTVLKKSKEPDDIATLNSLLSAGPMWDGIPRLLQALAMLSQSSNPNARPFDDHIYWEINLALWRAIDLSLKTFRLPKSVKEIGVEMPWNDRLNGFEYGIDKTAMVFTQKAPKFGPPLVIGVPISQIPNRQSFPLVESEIREWIEMKRHNL